MIAHLRGKIIDLAGTSLVVDVAGVGYEVFCSKSLMSKAELNSNIEILIHTEVREDSLSLYGFSSPLEKKVFLLLKTVKGLGAKSASEIISKISARELLSAIANEDLNFIQSIKGIGKKTAERIILELQDKVKAIATEHSLDRRVEVIKTEQQPAEEALEALCALGFVRKDAQRMILAALKDIPESELLKLNTGQLVSEALRYA